MVYAFKEWQVICDAMASERQRILLRKGGIHEGRAGFAFEHGSFFLFPTRFHAQRERVKEGKFMEEREWQEGDLVRIRHHAEVSKAVTAKDWEVVKALEPYHIYTEETLRERFDWAGKGMAAGSIHVALVRISELKRPWEIVYGKQYGGCRSWVALPEAPEGILDGAVPVLDDQEWEEFREEVGMVAGI